MPVHLIARRSLLVPALGLALAAALTACSSSGSSSSSPAATSTSPAAAATTAPASPSAPATTAAASPSATASSEATSGAAATAAIKQNWVAFFNPKSSVATKEALVQNGSKFEALLKSQASNPTAATASASVQSVKITSPTQATVSYTILVSGSPVLKGQKGTAVYQDGTWKVSKTSFCGLAALENGGKAPAVCA
jgi:hypothetical protein